MWRTQKSASFYGFVNISYHNLSNEIPISFLDFLRATN